MIQWTCSQWWHLGLWYNQIRSTGSSSMCTCFITQLWVTVNPVFLIHCRRPTTRPLRELSRERAEYESLLLHLFFPKRVSSERRFIYTVDSGLIKIQLKVTQNDVVAIITLQQKRKGRRRSTLGTASMTEFNTVCFYKLDIDHKEIFRCMPSPDPVYHRQPP